MATANPFDLLVDVDNDDPSHLIAVHQQKAAVKKPAAPTAGAVAPTATAKLPSKSVPPAQAVREARIGAAPARGGAGRGGPGRIKGGRGGGTGPNRDVGNENANGFTGGYGSSGRGGDGDAVKPVERERNYEKGRGDHGGPRTFRGGRRGGYGNGEAGGDSDRPPRRIFERRSGTGHGNEMKREGAGRGNWGNATDDVIVQETEEIVTEEKVTIAEKQPEQEGEPSSETNKESKEGAENEAGEKLEDKEMTLEEYEKIREEKRKALLALKAEERKVDFDREFESMQQLSIKKGNDEVFIKLGGDKDAGKRKDNADREERVKKALSINEFLKPAGERYYSPGGRGRGRGRGQGLGGFAGGAASAPAAPSIEDPSQFPTLGGK